MARRRRKHNRSGEHHAQDSLEAVKHGFCTRAFDSLLKAAKGSGPAVAEAKIAFFRRCVAPQRSA